MSACTCCFGNPYKNGECLPRHVRWRDGLPYSGLGHRVYRCDECKDTGVDPGPDGEQTCAEHPDVDSAVMACARRGLFVNSESA